LPAPLAFSRILNPREVHRSAEPKARIAERGYAARSRVRNEMETKLAGVEVDRGLDPMDPSSMNSCPSETPNDRVSEDKLSTDPRPPGSVSP
jgi:hypothetical protein